MTKLLEVAQGANTDESDNESDEEEETHRQSYPPPDMQDLQCKMIDKLFKNEGPVSQEIRQAELRFCVTLAEHNISFRAMDHRSELFGKMFHDS
ncbi:hypothetical protein JTB14_010229 [Gonioctena quinquepunctata]|nr:hypothetical protein JTB14_010229 [Gonioctena quinquepunctata]